MNKDILISGGWTFLMFSMATIDIIYIALGRVNGFIIAGLILCIIAFFGNLITFIGDLKNAKLRAASN
jgi:uncharacterized transporter YbjL